MWLYLISLNVISLLLVALDKAKAKRKGRRVRESWFFLLALAGGAMGIYAGMLFFRHKTKHRKFTYGIPLLIVINFIFIGCYYAY